MAGAGRPHCPGLLQPHALARGSKAEPEAYRHGTLGHSKPVTICLSISGSCGSLTHDTMTTQLLQSTVGVYVCMAASKHVRGSKRVMKDMFIRL
jgi:hypothetical protein